MFRACFLLEKLSKVRDAHNKKLNNLELENRCECHDPNNV